MLTPAAFAAAAGAEAAGGGGGSGPSGPPQNAATGFYGGSLVRVTWTNGDSSAQTRIYRSNVAKPSCPSGIGDLTLLTTRPAGTTSWDSSETDVCELWIAHYKDGILSTVSEIVQGESTSCGVACPDF